MLPKRSRLARDEVRRIIKSGKSARVPGLSCKYEALMEPKIAFVISKKVASGAVERNRLRRLAYRSLPSPLPRAHMVFFIQSSVFDPAQVVKLCSQLS